MPNKSFKRILIWSFDRPKKITVQIPDRTVVDIFLANEDNETSWRVEFDLIVNRFVATHETMGNLMDREQTAKDRFFSLKLKVKHAINYRFPISVQIYFLFIGKALWQRLD